MKAQNNNIKRFKIRKILNIFVALLAALSLPVSFNACGQQQSYDIGVQEISQSLGQGGISLVGQDGDSAEARDPVDNSQDTTQGDSTSGGAPGGITNPPSPVPVLPPQPIYVDVKQAVTVNAQNKTDILIVEDDSGSMYFEQFSMASRFSTFLSEIKDLDWQLAITTTDVSSNNIGKDGRLLSLRNEKGEANFGNILNSQMDPVLVKNLFENTIQRKSTETGSGWEQGIFATYRFLERFFDANEENAPNRQLLRSSATLAVIFVTDANESPASGVAPGEKNKGENLKKYLQQQLGGSKRFSFHSIIVKPDDSVCLNDRSTFSQDGKSKYNSNESYGTAYAELSQDTGGLIGSVCEQDYGSQLKAIGKLVADSVKTANLQCIPADVNKDGVPDVKAFGPSGEGLAIASIKDSVVTFVMDLPLGSSRLEYPCVK